MRTFSAQGMMNNMKNQLKNTGYSAISAKDGGTSNVLRLKEISHLSATFAERVLLGDAVRTLRSLGIQKYAFGISSSFFLISPDENISLLLYFCRNAANI
jgi:hypothetical protein